ncbi:hypothetical protein PIB30_111434, partial [Stylosanthes scabra]|nr:hypothetical protein [Stylosanthes scabra]
MVTGISLEDALSIIGNLQRRWILSQFFELPDSCSLLKSLRWGFLLEKFRQLACMLSHIWDKVTDIIHNPQELLDLLYRQVIVWKFEQFFRDMISWLEESVMK